jgi:hypothetical protein
MTESTTGNADDSTSSEYNGRRVELSLVLEFDNEQYLGADGEVNKDRMRREALDYAAEAAREGAFDMVITLLDEINK